MYFTGGKLEPPSKVGLTTFFYSAPVNSSYDFLTVTIDTFLVNAEHP